MNMRQSCAPHNFLGFFRLLRGESDTDDPQSVDCSANAWRDFTRVRLHDYMRCYTHSTLVCSKLRNL